jgi:hypothetical protein
MSWRLRTRHDPERFFYSGQPGRLEERLIDSRDNKTTCIYLQADLARRRGLRQSWLRLKEQLQDSSLPNLCCFAGVSRLALIIRSCVVENDVGTAEPVRGVTTPNNQELRIIVIMRRAA